MPELMISLETPDIQMKTENLKLLMMNIKVGWNIKMMIV